MTEYKAVTTFYEAHVTWKRRKTKCPIYTTVGALLVHLVGSRCMLRRNHSSLVHIFFVRLKHEKLEQFI